MIRSKFASDLASALAAEPTLKVFAFLTNLHLSAGEQDQLKEKAKKAGIEQCDVFDRERLRIELDSPGGYFIRFQYLGIPLSEAEQASFLSKYGSQIQEVVTSGFQRVERTLNRLLFLAEAHDTLRYVTVRLVLKEAYPASEVGHFRAFFSLWLHAAKHGIFAVCFGSADKSDRFRDDLGQRPDTPAGIAHGICSGQWEARLPGGDSASVDEPVDGRVSEVGEEEDERNFYEFAGWGSSIGQDPV